MCAIRACLLFKETNKTMAEQNGGGAIGTHLGKYDDKFVPRALQQLLFLLLVEDNIACILEGNLMEVL